MVSLFHASNWHQLFQYYVLMFVAPFSNVCQNHKCQVVF